MHHSREKREQAVPCRTCRKPTFEFDRRCQDCTEAATTPPCTDSYFTFDLDTQRVEVPPFRLDPAAVMAEILTASGVSMTTNESPDPGPQRISGNNIAGHSHIVTQKPQDRPGPLPEREPRATPSGPGPHNTCHHDEHDPNGTAATVCACIVLLVLLALATLGALWLAGNLP